MSAPRIAGLPRNQVLIGDARARLKELPDATVDCIITSPPYFGLRDYGMPAQFGLEDTVDEWVGQLREICRQLARILNPTGAFWLNVGDGYSAHRREGSAVKSLLLGPQRLAITLARDGWIVRNQVIWHKPNAIPQSVGDRLSNRYEVMMLLTRKQRYFFDLDAIREPAVTRVRHKRPSRAHYLPQSAVPFIGKAPRVDLNHGLRGLTAAGRKSHPLGKNPGDVWSVTTAGFRGAHFATFPLELIRRPLLATCPRQVCTGCGQPWRRAVRVIDGRKLATGALRPDCQCRKPPRPGVVLDPFLGSGTTALAAEQHGRDWIGIELNPEYARLAEERLAEARAVRTDAASKQPGDRPPPVVTAA